MKCGIGRLSWEEDGRGGDVWVTGSILERTRKGTVYGEREYRGKKISTGNSRKKRSAQGIPGKRDQRKKRTPDPGVMPQNWCSQVRRQGLEPWTPWLRVRCSTNWANSAYSNLLSRLNVVLRDASVIICDVFLKCKHFFKISAIFFDLFFNPDLPFSRSGSVPPKPWCTKGVLFSAWSEL